jgi:hypothetical protein
MTNSAVTSPNSNKKPRGKPLAKGYDERRWKNGRVKKPADLKAAEEMVRGVIWEILSEDLTNPSTGEKIDRLRAMLRSMTTSRQASDKQAILDRIIGKVAQSVDVTSAGNALVVQIVKASDDTDANKDQ